MEENIDDAKKSIDLILGSDTTLTRRKKTQTDVTRELFNKVIINLEQANARSFILENDFKLDLNKYDDIFYDAIDNLLVMHFGKEASELIFFYVYERINPDGSVNALADVNGDIVPMNGPSDLWELIEYMKNRKTK
jgi:hypothetical protein